MPKHMVTTAVPQALALTLATTQEPKLIRVANLVCHAADAAPSESCALVLEGFILAGLGRYQPNTDYLVATCLLTLDEDERWDIVERIVPRIRAERTIDDPVLDAISYWMRYDARCSLAPVIEGGKHESD